MKPILVIFFMLLCNLLHAQKDTLPKVQPAPAPVHDYTPKGRYVILYVEPAALLDGVDGQSYRFGVNYAFAPQWGIYSTYGRYFQEGYILKTGFKYYVDEDPSWRYAIGLEYINSWHVLTKHDYYEKNDSTQDRAPDDSRPVSVTASKHINAVSLILSGEHFWRHHLMIEWYGGLGVRWKNTLTNYPLSVLNQFYYYNDSVSQNLSLEPGSRVTLDLRFGIKIGCVL